MKFNNFDFMDALIVLVFGGAILLILGAPITGAMRTMTTQKALNEQCGTHYSFIEVATSSDNLSRLCQIKNQTVTVK